MKSTKSSEIHITFEWRWLWQSLNVLKATSTRLALAKLAIGTSGVLSLQNRAETETKSIPGIAAAAAWQAGESLVNQYMAMDSRMKKKNSFVSSKLNRLRFDTTPSAELWNPAIRYGPMESTYQHDYKKPVVIFPTVRAQPPPSTAFWNHSARYGPMESTYQHDYKTLIPIDYKNPFDTQESAGKVVPPPAAEERKLCETSEKFEQLLKGCQTGFEESRTFTQRVFFPAEELLSEKPVAEGCRSK